MELCKSTEILQRFIEFAIKFLRIWQSRYVLTFRLELLSPFGSTAPTSTVLFCPPPGLGFGRRLHVSPRRPPGSQRKGTVPRRAAPGARLITSFKNFQIFGGLVLGCIKTKFCKKICVWQHFSSSTRFASFCTAAISKFSQKIGLKNQQFSWKFSKNFANVAKFAKTLTFAEMSRKLLIY